MPDALYYRQWIINASHNIVPGIEPAILERTPFGDLSEGLNLYASLDHAERRNFIAGLQSVVAGGDDVPIEAIDLAIEIARTENIWDIEPEVRQWDERLPQEPWDYDERNRPENWREIVLRGSVNMFLISRDEHRTRI